MESTMEISLLIHIYNGDAKSSLDHMLMDSSLLLTIVAAAIIIGFFTLLSTWLFGVYKRFIFHPEKKDLDSFSSSSPSSSFSCKWTHDVFPSFRGEDVRRNFLSHIQKEFRRKGIIPFIDNDIKRGESIGPELIQAIRNSKIAIVLLSMNYPSSKWCLDELVEIMKCKEESGQIVFAVFYEVDPSEVKKLTGDFGAVFKKTCTGKTKEDIGRWRQALAKVATIAGYDSRNWDNEALMIENIVAEISKRLIHSTPTRYLEGLIGMGAHMEKMKQLLCLDSDEVRMIGVWGPPGIGKTTIARVTYDQISDGFQLSVFMDIKSSYARSTCSDDYNVKLQLEQQFLSQLINQEDVKIRHLGAAQKILMDKKVLVILDGVDHLVQLLALPQARYLGPGTRIIITTQDLKILKAFEIDQIYRVNFPPREEALQIFCISAFGQKSPYDGFEKLAREVTHLAGCLPLGLGVMGSHLRGMSKKEWEEELPRLRICLDGEIGSILKFCYDALEEEEKDLFLYIACFFEKEGLNDDIFEDVLRHRFSNVRQGLKILVQRSLLFEDKNLWMHGLLVQLGKEIVRYQSIHEPAKRQFLVDAKEISDVLTDNTGSRNIVGIDLDNSKMEDDLYISERAFEEMSNLQLLRFHYGLLFNKRLHLPQGLKCLPPKLRIIHWDYYPVKYLPSNFSPKFLVKIYMEHSKLEKLWEGIHPLKNLKLMNLNYSKNIKELPDLSTATNLMSMELQRCSSLMELPSSIGNLVNLQNLNLKGCSRLLKLPPSVGNIKCLLRLNLSACSSLVELPSSVGNLTSLENLNLEGCSSLVKLPSYIGNAKNLQSLNISECSSLMEFAPSIRKVVHLKKLNLGDCSNQTELLSSIGNPSNLEELSLRECNLVELPSSIADNINLKYLSINDLSNLAELPSSIGNAINLELLSIQGCSRLVELPSSIGNLTNLQTFKVQTFKVQTCSSLMELPCTIGNLTNLQTLNLSGFSNLVELPSSIGNLTNLQTFKVQTCSSLMELPCTIGNLTNLQTLNLSGCSNLVELPSSIGNLTNLHNLKLGDCSHIVELPSSIGNVINLINLDFGGLSSLAKLPSSIGNLTNLYNLYFEGSSNLVELPSSIGNLTNLQGLHLNDCSSLVELPSSIGNLANLHRLDLSGCSSLVKIPSSIGNLQMLKKLTLQRCSSLVELPSSIGNLQMLKRLSLQRCSKLEVLPININLGSLKELDVTGCSQLRRFPEISTNVERLMLCGTLIKEAPLSIKSWSRLQDLRTPYFKTLEENLHVLDIITELEFNDIEIEELPPWVYGISRLRRLELNKCKKLVSLPQLPGSLSSLDAENCDSLEILACSFPNIDIGLTFVNCWKLNEEAREIIIQASSRRAAVFPGRQVPAFFTYRATTTRGSLTMELNQRFFPTSLRFKACILLVNKVDERARDEKDIYVSSTIVDKQGGILMFRQNYLHPLLTEHLYTFEVVVENVEFREIFFEFRLESNEWEIAECGVREF